VTGEGKGPVVTKGGGMRNGRNIIGAGREEGRVWVSFSPLVLGL